MDEAGLIAAAIPIFFVLIAAEYAWSVTRGRPTYRLPDTISNLSLGLGQQATGLLWRFATVWLYAWVYGQGHLFAWASNSVFTWLIALLAVDHQYYWWHRASHRVRWLWTAHGVHHQSEDYNLAVALRQEWWGHLTYIPFALLIAWFGVPTEVWVGAELIVLLYQFWIHTEQIDRLGPLEYIFNTPSHHRVHHAANPAYIDKNYAGILIIWDKLYGTFVPETTRPTYGTVTPLRSSSPLWAHIAPWVSIGKALSQRPTVSEKLRYLWQAPEQDDTVPGGVIEIPEPVAQRHSWDPQPTTAVKLWAGLHFILVAVGLVATILWSPMWTWSMRITAVVMLVGSCAVLTGLLDQRSWASKAELARLVCLGILLRLAT